MEISGLKWFLFLVINQVTKELEKLASNTNFYDLMVDQFEYYDFDSDVKNLKLHRIMNELGILTDEDASYLLRKCIAVLKMMNVAIPADVVGSTETKAYLVPGVGYVSDEEWGDVPRIYGLRSAFIKSIIDRATSIGLSPFMNYNPSLGYALNTDGIGYAFKRDVEKASSPEIKIGPLKYVQGDSTKMDCIGLVSYLLQTPDTLTADLFQEYTQGSGAKYPFREVSEYDRQPGDVVQFIYTTPKYGPDSHVVVFTGPIGPIAGSEDQILESAYEIGPRWATLKRLFDWITIRENGQISSVKYFRKR